ncbi:hypothetical protein EYY95_09890 [Hafnia alvei]|uniref:Glycosyl transferase family 2 n=1 Tax=Hafnia alvei TaxID=569 RepID=A0A172X072_HAFAL|nr:hypothetical protein [Hafnia alvei]ANF30019.1 hypothetical protein [Hafnia alvei]TBL88146.1 hypothetical protein EYY95_09890 [Hafnia alvei]
MNILINKILFLISSFFETVKFIFLSYFFSWKRPQLEQSSSYIISLTSYHKRFGTLHLVLESFFYQKLKPREIHLWLSKKDLDINGGIPKRIKRLENDGLIIHIKNDDIGSYKKLSYINDLLIQVTGIKHVITADDDVLYPKYWSEELLLKSMKDNCVSCFRGHDLRIYNGIFDYKKSMSLNVSGSEPNYSLLPTGCSGVAYPIGSISREVSSSDKFLSVAPKADDIWYKAMTLKNGYKSSRVYAHNVHFPVLINCLSESLYSSNVNNNENNIKLKNTFHFFDVTKYFY